MMLLRVRGNAAEENCFGTKRMKQLDNICTSLREKESLSGREAGNVIVRNILSAL